MNRFALLAALLPAIALAAPSEAPAPRDISLDECIRTALRENLDLKIQRVDRDSADLDVSAARGAYDPAFSLSASRSHSESSGKSAGTAEGVLATADSDVDEDSISAGLSGKTSLAGLSYDLSAKSGRSRGSRDANPFDTASASLGLSLTQPLLEGFRTDSARYQLASARSLSREAALALERKAESVVADVVSAWCDFVAARESVAVQKEAVRLAEQLLEDSVRKVRVGALAPLDETQASAQAASARADLADARRSLLLAQNALKNRVFSDIRSVRSRDLSPLGSLDADEFVPDADAASDAALENRPDLRSLRLALSRQGLAVDFRRDQTLPSLDLVAGAGLAASDEDSYGDAWDRLASADEPFWSVGLRFSVPVGNRAERAALARALAAEERARLELRRAEESVLVEVDDAVAAVRTGWARILAARDAAEYARQALDAERKKLDSGKSTDFVVLQLQKNLTAARQADIAASAAYLKALSSLALADSSILPRFSVSIDPDPAP